MRYLLYEQKFLELLDDRKILDAIKCLRKDIVKIPGKQNCSHYLVSLAMFPSKEEVRKSASWPGKGKYCLRLLRIVWKSYIGIYALQENIQGCS